jgi:hypothetical protein
MGDEPGWTAKLEGQREKDKEKPIKIGNEAFYPEDQGRAERLDCNLPTMKGE